MEQNKINALCDYLASSISPTSLRWGWGEGLLAYAFIVYDLYTNQTKHLDFAKEYVDYYCINKPNMDCSDRIAPALAANELYKLTKEEKYNELTLQAVDYIVNCEKILGDVPNHFGTSKKEASYPQSVWVDSLMMFSFFTSVYGKDINDDSWLSFSYRQVDVFASHLMDMKTNLWYHAYWVKEKLQYPKGNLFWGRGNGWVALSLPLIYENLKSEEDKEKLKEIYKKSIDAMINCQYKDGSFKTLLKHFETVKETSATALIAAGIYKAVKLNMLDASYLKNADKAYDYCLKNIKVTDEGVFFKKISGSTVPLERHPYLWYVTRKEKINASYGVFAIVLAYIFKGQL